MACHRDHWSALHLHGEVMIPCTISILPLRPTRKHLCLRRDLRPIGGVELRPADDLLGGECGQECLVRGQVPQLLVLWPGSTVLLRGDLVICQSTRLATHQGTLNATLSRNKQKPMPAPIHPFKNFTTQCLTWVVVFSRVVRSLEEPSGVL